MWWRQFLPEDGEPQRLEVLGVVERLLVCSTL
eukprot:COSAG02_NODE_64054_length_261_cov_0.969136_2_plen_31_part_01